MSYSSQYECEGQNDFQCTALTAPSCLRVSRHNFIAPEKIASIAGRCPDCCLAGCRSQGALHVLQRGDQRIEGAGDLNPPQRVHGTLAKIGVAAFQLRHQRIDGQRADSSQRTGRNPFLHVARLVQRGDEGRDGTLVLELAQRQNRARPNLRISQSENERRDSTRVLHRA